LGGDRTRDVCDGWSEVVGIWTMIAERAYSVLLAVGEPWEDGGEVSVGV